MTSYLVLEAPNGPDRDHKTTRFIADHFVWLALVAPCLWLAINRLWLAAAVVFITLFLACLVSMLPGFEPAGIFFYSAIAILTMLEGHDFLIRHLICKGWKITSIISAPDLSSAEDIYFSALFDDTGMPERLPQPVWTPSPRKRGDRNLANDPTESFLFDLNGKR